MSPAERLELLSSIEAETARLARFVANLLDMSRIEAGGLKVRVDRRCRARRGRAPQEGVPGPAGADEPRVQSSFRARRRQAARGGAVQAGVVRATTRRSRSTSRARRIVAKCTSRRSGAFVALRTPQNTAREARGQHGCLRAFAGITSVAMATATAMGRPSIPPEKLLRAMLLQAFYSIRSR